MNSICCKALFAIDPVEFRGLCRQCRRPPPLRLVPVFNAGGTEKTACQVELIARIPEKDGRPLISLQRGGASLNACLVISTGCLRQQAQPGDSVSFGSLLRQQCAYLCRG